MNITSSANSASRIEVAAKRAASVDVAVGAAIQALSGTVWLTQEGDPKDHWLPAGVTFFADRAGRAVLTAVHGPSVVIVREGPSDIWVGMPGTVRVDSVARLTHAARAAQAEYLATAFVNVVWWIVTAVKRLASRKHARAR